MDRAAERINFLGAPEWPTEICVGKPDGRDVRFGCAHTMRRWRQMMSFACASWAERESCPPACAGGNQTNGGAAALLLLLLGAVDHCWFPSEKEKTSCLLPCTPDRPGGADLSTC